MRADNTSGTMEEEELSIQTLQRSRAIRAWISFKNTRISGKVILYNDDNSSWPIAHEESGLSPGCRLASRLRCCILGGIF